MENVVNYIKRNIIWIAALILSIILLNPGIAEIKTLMLVIAVESIALCFSGVAVFAYTKIDFIKEQPNQLGMIFLGVHISVGLVILGVYITQFAG
jgi:hypothetical protein